ncbi:MAG: transketolase C-terminal domain-containing protein, partial [Fimbriimonadales bacterium]
WTAMQDDDPTLLLIPKHIFRVRRPVSAYEPVPFGKAQIRRAGEHVTVVAWGNTLELAEQAAEAMAQQGISLEIIDPRTLVPFDWATVEQSLAKTGRLVVIHEDNRTCGFGQAIISEMTTVPDRFNLLLAPPQLVARYDVHIPFCPELEYAVLPDLPRVLQAIQTVLE